MKENILTKLYGDHIILPGQLVKELGMQKKSELKIDIRRKNE